MFLNSKTRTKDCLKVFGTGNFLIQYQWFPLWFNVPTFCAISNFPIVDNLMRLMERFCLFFVCLLFFCKVQGGGPPLRATLIYFLPSQAERRLHRKKY